MTKKLTIVLVVVGILGVGIWLQLGGGGRPSVTLRGTRVVAFGDGLTALQAADAPSYPELLGEKLGVTITNLGKRGDSSATAATRLSQVLALQPDLVVMTLGYEDLKQKIALGETYAMLENILSQLRQQQIVVVFGGIVPPEVGDNWPLAVSQLCKSMGVVYVDDILAKAWGHDEFWSSDGLPNTAGHNMIAEKFYETIKPFWPATSSSK